MRVSLPPGGRFSLAQNISLRMLIPLFDPQGQNSPHDLPEGGLGLSKKRLEPEILYRHYFPYPRYRKAQFWGRFFSAKGEKAVGEV